MATYEFRLNGGPWKPVREPRTLMFLKHLKVTSLRADVPDGLMEVRRSSWG